MSFHEPESFYIYLFCTIKWVCVEKLWRKLITLFLQHPCSKSSCMQDRLRNKNPGKTSHSVLNLSPVLDFCFHHNFCVMDFKVLNYLCGDKLREKFLWWTILEAFLTASYECPQCTAHGQCVACSSKTMCVDFCTCNSKFNIESELLQFFWKFKCS